MLTETRQEQILRLLREKGSVTVTELTEHFGASESTIRRDLNALHKKGALVKVFGGAVQTGEKLSTKEEKVSLRASPGMRPLWSGRRTSSIWTQARRRGI